MEILRTIIVSASIAFLFHVVWSWYWVRSRLNRLQKKGFPMHEWSWLFGHLLVLRQYMRKYPSDVFINVVTKEMLYAFPQTDMFYLDLWPFMSPILCIGEPAAARQLTSKHTFPKPPLYRYLFDPIMGGPNLLTMNGETWKSARATFNPGFNHKYLLHQVPGMMDRIEIFRHILRERADTHNVFPLEEVLTRLTIDIIGKVVLDDDLGYQRASNPLADSLRSLIDWSSFGNPFAYYHPIRPLAVQYYSGIMNYYITKALRRRFEEIQQQPTENPKHDSRSAISLVLKEHFKNRRTRTLDRDFLRFAIPQIRVFLFAGHDTTTSIIIYTYHVLSRRDDILKRMQQEHTDVFGDDLDLPTLRTNVSLLDQLPYTMAVIKETMRIYPPAGTMRQGVAGAYISDRNGTQYPTEGVQATIFHLSLHHNPRVWPRPLEFLPERWLAQSDDPLYPQEGAFRGFELGPRNCIGQDLALLEIRLVLVMTIREFKITPAYEKWDALRRESWLSSVSKRLGIKKDEPRPTIDGDRAYPVEKGGAHPAHGYPCEVSYG